LMDNITFKIIQDGKPIFQSEKHWLMPLFDFEDYLKDHPLELSAVEAHDKIIGKAAALLMVRLGIGSAHAEVMSKLARGVFNQASIPHTFHTLVDRIDCQTEEILLDINDPDLAYQILYQRAHPAV
jgi:hypothetical protein